jgi:hypothetical protein
MRARDACRAHSRSARGSIGGAAAGRTATAWRRIEHGGAGSDEACQPPGPTATGRDRYAAAVAFDPRLIIELPRDGSVERQLEREHPEAIASGAVVVEAGPTDEQGNLEAPAAGQLVYSVPSPEALPREADEIRRVLQKAGSGAEPLVVAVEVAEELRAEEIGAVLRAAEHASRPAILRIVREV